MAAPEVKISGEQPRRELVALRRLGQLRRVAGGGSTHQCRRESDL